MCQRGDIARGHARLRLWLRLESQSPAIGAMVPGELGKRVPLVIVPAEALQ